MSNYPDYFNKVLIAHGVCGAVAWVVLFPLGGIIIRVMNHRSSFWIHTWLQIFAYALFCVTFGTGVWFSVLYGAVTDPHPILGLILFGLTTLQPFLGSLHHARFTKVSRRTFWAILHIQLGRMLIPVGMITGGLGLVLGAKAKVPASRGWLIAYGVVAGTMWVAYIVIVSATERKDVLRWYEKAAPEGLTTEEGERSSVASAEIGDMEKAA